MTLEDGTDVWVLVEVSVPPDPGDLIGIASEDDFPDADAAEHDSESVWIRSEVRTNDDGTRFFQCFGDWEHLDRYGSITKHPDAYAAYGGEPIFSGHRSLEHLQERIREMREDGEL